MAKAANTDNAFQIQVSGPDVNMYNFAMAHLRTLTGVTGATPQLINPSGTSYILVNYHGSIAQLAAGLSGRGWIVETSGGNVVKLEFGVQQAASAPTAASARGSSTAAGPAAGCPTKPPGAPQ